MPKNNRKASWGFSDEVEISGLCFNKFTLVAEWKMDYRGHDVFGIINQGLFQRSRQEMMV